MDGARTGEGWCRDSSDIKTSGLVTSVKWKFDEKPYVIAGGVNWRKSGKLTYCSYTLTACPRNWQPVIDAADAIRVTIEDVTGNYDDKIAFIEYRVLNCKC